MYTLLQGIIERCLATKLPDGTYLVSPTIFDETMNGGEFAAISQWTERTYPDGVLNEVSGYVKNLMDNYPSGLLLKAIDDKLWELGSCSSGVHDPESIYGNLMDTPPYWSAFWDITFAMTQAGVVFDPVTFEMLVVPARASSTGEDEYGPPTASSRMYPEVLIARYKVMQQLRYKKAPISDTRRFTGGFGDAYSHFETTNNGSYWPTWWTHDYVAGLYNEACANARSAWSESVSGIQDPNILSYWLIWHGLMNATQSFSYTWFAQMVTGYSGGSGNNFSAPKLTINKGYSGITHNVKLWAYWDGNGDLTLWTQSGGDPVVAGKNLILEINNISADTVWQAGFEDAENTLHFPPFCPTWPPGAVSYWVNFNGQLTLQAYEPIEDWEFQFCKHSDFGGDVTWVA
jgi:hypothetical protein